VAERTEVTEGKKRRSGVPTGNAGEYFVMGELLRRGYDAQLADRNTKGYDLLVGRVTDENLRKVQVKTVRAQPWYVSNSGFTDDLLDRVTIYVLVGKDGYDGPVRYFLAKNRDVVGSIYHPPKWKDHGFVGLKDIVQYEDNWKVLLERERGSVPDGSLRM